jgi:hypothetical protein
VDHHLAAPAPTTPATQFLIHRRRPPPSEPVDPPPSDEEELADGVLHLKDAATFLGHSTTWVWEQIRAGELTSFVLGRRRVLPKRQLVAYLVRKRREWRATVTD